MYLCIFSQIFQYFEQDDPDLYLSKIKYLLENNIDEIETELFFVEEQYDTNGQLVKNVELIPNGSRIRVANSTKLQYLDALAQYRLATSIKDEMEAFLRGLNELIPDNLLSIFDENELEVSRRIFCFAHGTKKLKKVMIVAFIKRAIRCTILLETVKQTRLFTKLSQSIFRVVWQALLTFNTVC